MLLSHILPVFLVISSVVDDVNAQCSYLNDRNRQRRLGANGRALQEDEDDDDEEVFDSGFRYGSMFNSTVLPPFNSKSAFELIEASKAGGYMDSDQRSTSFFESPPFRTKDRCDIIFWYMIVWILSLYVFVPHLNSWCLFLYL